MLLYIQDLLWHADIGTTQLHLNTKAGTRLIDSKNGRTYIRRKNCYALHVRARSLPRFAESIGFTIEENKSDFSRRVGSHNGEGGPAGN
ncbi:hypothetical protein AUI06_11280 [archaeon 13_2_20CM_2_52_21]|nr:MAG: hypothetical protein AUI06_11280 [archaeon 13_2_20CM_2_52_21]OLD08472.1 MAG: hypothetical protein AUI95_03040 [Crenarchaeota archaeon 13_1_40CM_3_52_4]